LVVQAQAMGPVSASASGAALVGVVAALAVLAAFVGAPHS